MRAKIESINLVGVYFRNPPPTKMFFSVYNNGESDEPWDDLTHIQTVIGIRNSNNKDHNMVCGQVNTLDGYTEERARAVIG